jgi:hypothetical protein
MMTASGISFLDTCKSPASTALGEREGQTSPSTTALTTIDLAKLGDLNLVHRAILRGWPISQQVREQVRSQLPAAIDALGPGDHRADRRFKKLAALMVGMGMGDPIGRSAPASEPPRRRKRNPDRRRLRQLGRQRAREALHERVTKGS